MTGQPHSEPSDAERDAYSWFSLSCGAAIIALTGLGVAFDVFGSPLRTFALMTVEMALVCYCCFDLVFSTGSDGWTRERLGLRRYLTVIVVVAVLWGLVAGGIDYAVVNRP